MSNSTATVETDWIPDGVTILLHTVPVQATPQVSAPVSSDANASGTVEPTAAVSTGEEGSVVPTDEATAVVSGDDDATAIPTETGDATDIPQPTDGSKKRKLHLHIRGMRQQRDDDIEDDNDPDMDETTVDTSTDAEGLAVTLDELSGDAESYIKSIYDKPLYQVSKPVAEDPGNAEQDYARLIGYKGFRELMNSPDKRDITDGVLTLTEKNLPIDAGKVKARVCKSDTLGTLVMEQDEEGTVAPDCPAGYTEQNIYGDFILTATQASNPSVISPSTPPQAISGAGITAPDGLLMIGMVALVALKTIRNLF